MYDKDFEFLKDAFKSLPGVGNKQATNMAYYVLKQSDTYVDTFVDRLIKAKKNIHFCKQCNNFTSHELCDICSNESRDQHKLCIVSNPEDVEKIESTNEYIGIYFVLNDEMDVRKQKIIDEKLIQKIIQLIKSKNITEVILATNWTINGEATATYIRNILKSTLTVGVYRLALGLPINSALEYADNLTLKHAIKNKVKY